jgi:hypothetical protein
MLDLHVEVPDLPQGARYPLELMPVIVGLLRERAGE